MHWSKPVTALLVFCLAVAVVGAIVNLLLSSLLATASALLVLALVVVALAAMAYVGSRSTRRRHTPYW